MDLDAGASADRLLIRASVEHADGRLDDAAATLDRLLELGPVGWNAAQAITGRLLIAATVGDDSAVREAADRWIAARRLGDHHLDSSHLDEEPIASGVPAELLAAMRSAVAAPVRVAETVLGLVTARGDREWTGNFRDMEITFVLPEGTPDDPVDPEHEPLLGWVRGFVIGIREREARWVLMAVEENTEFLAADDRDGYRIVAGNFSLQECLASNGRGPDLIIAIDERGAFDASFIAH